MTAVGRNDPCPCGSGRKFKKCCLGKTDGPAPAFTRDEREAALDFKEMEVMAERDRRAGRPAYDFTWMWAELGLERPG